MRRRPSPSVESLVWSITWAKAFPTFLPNVDCLGIENDTVWQILAFDAIFNNDKHSRLEESEWIHTRDEASMEQSLGYGEITIPAVAEIVARIRQDLPDQAVVLDLGSGNGRVLLAACLAFPFSKAIGLEIVPELHEEARQNLREWNHHEVCADDEPTTTSTRTIVDFQFTDFTHHASSIAAANLIFIHATVFSDSLMEQVQNMCQTCASGTYFIMVTKALLESNGIETLESLRLDMNWGEATVYIQQMKSTIGPL